MLYMLLAEGFEDIEAIAPLDILRRAGIEVRTVAVGENPVRSKCRVPVTADMTVEQADPNAVQGIILPGGIPGVTNLEKDPRVPKLIRAVAESGGVVAAICAAPSLLGNMGLLNGRHAICYPGYEKQLRGARICSDESVVRDGQFITAKGAGVSLEFGYKIAEVFAGAEASDNIASAMMFVNHARQLD